ncbi:MAG: HAD family hydrolase [Rhodospirillaceae bacterium]
MSHPVGSSGFSKRRISVVITDIDNTLFDWLAVWHASFSALLTKLGETSGLAEDVLLAEIKAVFRRYGTSEFGLLIQELPSLTRQHPGRDLKGLYGEAIDHYRRAGQKTLRLYPGVYETLKTLRQCGVLVVGFTESKARYTTARVNHLDLDGLLTAVYAPGDHPLALDRYGAPWTQTEKQPATKWVERSHQLKKPYPDQLKRILSDFGVKASEALYIGDSLYKDVQMAQDADVIDVHAAYGAGSPQDHFTLISRVTHWSDAELAKSRNFDSAAVRPSLVLEESFSELLEHFDFTAFGAFREPPMGCVRRS